MCFRCDMSKIQTRCSNSYINVGHQYFSQFLSFFVPFFLHKFTNFIYRNGFTMVARPKAYSEKDMEEAVLFTVYVKFYANCPVLAFLSWLSLHGCPFIDVLLWLSFLSHLVLAVLSWLSCHSFPFIVVLSQLYFHSCPYIDVLLWLSCHSCPVLAVLTRLSCHGSPVNNVLTILQQRPLHTASEITH